MICVKCKTEGPEGARFYMSCGSELFTDERLKSLYLQNAGVSVPEPA